MASNCLKKIYIFLFLLLLSQQVLAQREKWYTSDGTLSSSLINQVLYDSRAMLWITTEDCLNRFDGSKFTVYYYDPDNSRSIANDHVNSVFEDNQGRLFVCSHAGVQLYDPATDSFGQPLKVFGRQEESSSIVEIVQRNSGELWAVGNEVFRIIEKDGELTLEVVDNLPKEIVRVQHGIADSDDNIWLSLHSEGLYKINKAGNVSHYFGKVDDPEPTAFALGKDGSLYMGTAKRGLYRYDKVGDRFIHIPLNSNIEGFTIYNIYTDDNGLLLIATDGAGLIGYNPADESIFPFIISNINYDKLKVHGLTKDSYGNLWAGVYQKGLLKMPKLSVFFGSIDEHNTNIIGSCCVTAIEKDLDNILWVATDNDHLYAVDLTTRTSKHYTDGVPATIMSMCIDSKDRLWIGSYNNGLGMVDRKTGKYTPINLDPNRDVLHVYEFAELPNGEMLVATMGAGLYRYNPDTGVGEQVKVPNMSDWIQTLILSDDQQEIYAGTYDGFFILNKDLTLKKWLIPTHIVTDIHEEPKYGDIWLATNEGLARINKNREIQKIYTTADGLPSQSIQAIEHGDDALWLSTNRGLTKFNVINNTFTNFNVDNGLPNNEFYRNSSHRDSDGVIYFGGINGIATFNANNIDVGGEKLTLRVTDFLLGGSSINASTMSGNHKIIDTAVTDATQFNLGHDDNSFSVHVNVKEFVSISQSDFYFSFDDKEWIKVADQGADQEGVTLTFSNVSSGDHVLRVKLINAGIETDELVLNIHIDEVWYASWWMKTIYVLLFLALVSFVYFQAKKRLRMREEEERRRHQSEILESKLQFFTNISHEIRTPLSLVIGPLQKLRETTTDKALASTYNVILRNANRILRLVNELMDLRKIDNKQMKLRFTKVNLCTFINDLYDTFNQAAIAKKIDFQYIRPENNEVIAWVDLSNFDKIVMNILSNAIKFTPEGGKITLAICHGVDMYTDGPLHRFIEISVTDTGIGVSPDDRKYIFNRFFQAEGNKVGGTGIGLHLTSQLVNMHYGIIEVEDNPEGQGSRFVVRIPSGKNHLSEEELSDVDETESLENPDDILAKEININAMDAAEDIAIRNRAPRSNKTVFVVEDDEEIRNYLMSNLGHYFHTEGFTNGKLALEAIHQTPPDLVITDVMMPEMDGYTLTKKIKQNINLNQIPVIILTAKTRDEDNLEAIDSGADVFIPKPFNIDVVVRTAQNMIESVSRLRNAFLGNQSQEDKLEDIEVISNDDKLMERVMKVINKNLSNSEMTVEMIAKEIGISRVHLHRKLKEITNQSTRYFIRNIRLQAAAKLLREKKLTVAEVSDLVGFKQANNFSTVFKEMYGVSPTAYAAKYHNMTEEGL